MASQTSPLCVISGTGSKSVSFSVTEAVLGNVNQGDSIRIEKNGSEYQGTITEVNTMVDQATGLFKVKASVSDGDTLVSGSSVKLYITSDKVENVMTIPVDAVYYDNGVPYVYTYDGGTVHKVLVETGLADSERIEIQSGLSKDQLVITTWSPELYEGAPAELEDQSGGVTVETAQPGAAGAGETEAEADAAAGAEAESGTGAAAGSDAGSQSGMSGSAAAETAAAN